MAFNSASYRRNQYRRKALAELEAARNIKRRLAAGCAYPWEGERIATFVKLARISWRLYLSLKRSR